ncbi:MAG: hypothetical protein OXU23_07285 [Candidatus Poribacteria bacterium]|nr:hypothetical protein [Candidatus Poribacteria bacterium]
MHKRIATGLFVLIFALGVAIVFYHQYTDIQQLKQEAAEAEKLLEGNEKPVAENKLPPAEPGKKWVPHGDHFHQVPIDAPDVWQGEPHEPVAKEVQAKPTYTGPLTYHTELLKTNPVKALRLQSEERGHWSAEHIPPFPADDTEAQEYARNIYLINYYVSTGDESNPILGRAIGAHQSQNRAIDAQLPKGGPVPARDYDLWRLTWPLNDAGKITPYGGMTRYGRARMFPSDYFPGFIDVPE